MNLLQKIAVAAVGIAALGMLLFPPFYARASSGAEINLGYAFVLDPPRDGRALVHTPTLYAQLVGLLVVGAAGWLLAGSIRQS